MRGGGGGVSADSCLDLELRGILSLTLFRIASIWW